MVKVLIVDDSLTARLTLRYMLAEAGDLQVVAEASNGEEGIRQVQATQPDIILMDLVMPDMDGLQATEEIMSIRPTPIILMSATFNEKDLQIPFQAMRLGALAVEEKPVGHWHPSYQADKSALIAKLRALSSVKVIHHHKTSDGIKQEHRIQNIPKGLPKSLPQIIAVAVSTGGPGLMAEILRHLPENYPSPIVVVQHMTHEFLPALVHWLDGINNLNVKIAEENEMPQPGHVYYAPGNAHLRINSFGRFELDTTTVMQYMPSADILMQSVAKHYSTAAVGLILTGMGNDGAKGIKLMFDKGAYTIAQDEQTSVVYGMPREAIALGAINRIASTTEISEILRELGKRKRNI